MVGSIMLLLNTDTSASWFDDAWQYRRAINFTHNAAIGSPRRVTITINTATPIAAGKMQDDCDDVRFTDINGLLLQFQLTGSCDNAATTFDVVFPTINNGTNPAYIYYGNMAAGSASQDVSGVTSLSPSGGAPSTAGEEVGLSPALYLSFNENYDSTAHDATTNANHGTIAGALWQTDDMCVSSNCLWFDGTDDVVTVANAPAIDFSSGLANGVTIQGWIRPNSLGEGSQGQIFNKGTNTYIRFGSGSSAGVANLDVSLELSSSNATISVADAITLNRWHHVSMTYTNDGDDEITVYVDGIARGTSTNGAGNPVEGDVPVLIGGPTTANFHGFIDEFRIYPYERSADQIKTDVIKGASASGSAAAFGHKDQSYLSDGLVGYWKMDEPVQNTCGAGVSSCDSSGNENHIQWQGPSNGSGKFGRSLRFWSAGARGVGGDPASGALDITGNENLTISAWFNRDNFAADNTIVAKKNDQTTGAGYILYIDDATDDLNFVVADGTNSYTINGATAITATGWHHVVAVFDRNSPENSTIYLNGIDNKESVSGNHSAVGSLANALNFHVGSESDDQAHFRGNIDELRVYNRAFFPTQATALYNWAPGPIGHWKLDENTGSGSNVVKDISGNNLHGSTNGGMTDANWQPGRHGSSLYLDGTDDYISIPDPGTNSVLDWQDASSGGSQSSEITLMAWVKLDALPAPDQFISSIAKANNNGTDGTNYTFFYGNGGTYELGICTNDGDWLCSYAENIPLQVGVWHHTAVRISNFSSLPGDFFLDGVKYSGTGSIFAPQPSNGPLWIGAVDYGPGVGVDEPHQGPIDDVRIYNYMRTDAQIIEDMNGGHPVGGSPVGSQVAYWKFDEGHGTTAHDSGPHGHHLTLSAASWTANGKYGHAFNGTGGAVRASLANHNDFNFAGTDDFSISLWFRSDTATNPTAANQWAVHKRTNATGGAIGYATWFNSSGQYCFGIDDDATSFPEDVTCGTTDLFDGAGTT